MKQHLFTAVLLAATASTAHAVPFLEVGDAGHLIGTAQDVGVGIDSITGELVGSPVTAGAGDIDVYRLNLAAGLFTATATAGSFDTALVLFDAMGIGLRADDDSAGGTNSLLSETLAAGVYYLGIFPIGDFSSPSSAGGSIWTDVSFDSNTQPDGPGAASPWTGWIPSGFIGESGTYTLTLNQSSVAAVSEPATLALLGLGLAGIAGFRRRRA